MKNLRITVNGKTYDVQVEETGATAAPAAAVAAPAPVAAPVAAAPAPAAQEPAPQVSAPSADATAVECPMPGTILAVNVSAGDNVKEGDVLVILEAMKMENEICAPQDGVVDAVCVNKGDTVSPGQTLVSIK